MKKSKRRPFLLTISKVIKVLRIRFSYLLPTLYARLYLSLMQCSFGKSLKVCGKVYFRPNGANTIQLGNNVTLTARFLSNTVGITNPTILECIGSGRIIIGDNSGLTSAIVSSRHSIEIGSNVNIGSNVRIFDHDFHALNYLHRRKGGKDSSHVTSESVIIEDDVFIGTNSLILKGVHIGGRSIIGAGSVVTLKNIPTDSLVAGNPAVIVKANIN